MLIPITQYQKLRELSKLYGVSLSLIICEGIDLWKWRQEQER
jgi:hypothetical protein